MSLPKIHSISKKVIVALLGSFLLIFLLFHACANLCILRHDGGEWYGAFCHFMGTNIFVKIFELLLFGCLLLHIALTLWLWFTNRQARPLPYRHGSATKTHPGSKLQFWTGLLIAACLLLHFTDFYFVKLGITGGRYMVKTEQLMTDEVSALQQASAQYGMTPEDFIAANEQQLAEFADQLDPEQLDEINAELDKLRAAVPVAQLLGEAAEKEQLSADKQWVKNIDKETMELLEEAGIDAEPDFYYQAREKFANPYIAFMYLLFFVIVWFHLRHAFAAAFQTLGLYNYKYGNAIEWLACLYAWLVCLCFAAVVVLVYLGL